jgi:hypothetical protein
VFFSFAFKSARRGLFEVAQNPARRFWNSQAEKPKVHALKIQNQSCESGLFCLPKASPGLATSKSKSRAVERRKGENLIANVDGKEAKKSVPGPSGKGVGF